MWFPVVIYMFWKDNRVCFLAFKLLLTMMAHDHNTRKKHGNDSDDDDPLTNAKRKENIINHINVSLSYLRNEFLNLKDIVIKRLHDKHTGLQSKCKSLENKVTRLEEDLNSLISMEGGIILFFQAYKNVWLMNCWRLQYR